MLSLACSATQTLWETDRLVVQLGLSYEGATTENFERP
jgi:hypothetical protein